MAHFSLPYEVSTQAAAVALVITLPFSRLSSHHFIVPSVFKADVTLKRKVSCYISLSSKNKQVWAHATTGAVVFPLNICTLLQSDCTQQI